MLNQDHSLKDQLTVNQGTKTLLQKKPRMKSKDIPKRPLCAFNIFFLLERERILNDQDRQSYTIEDMYRITMTQKLKDKQPKRKHRKSHGKIGFKELARTIAKAWKELSTHERKLIEAYAAIEKAQHQCVLHATLKVSSTEHQTETPISPSIIAQPLPSAKVSPSDPRPTSTQPKPLSLDKAQEEKIFDRYPPVDTNQHSHMKLDNNIFFPNLASVPCSGEEEVKSTASLPFGYDTQRNTPAVTNKSNQNIAAVWASGSVQNMEKVHTTFAVPMPTLNRGEADRSRVHLCPGAEKPEMWHPSPIHFSKEQLLPDATRISGILQERSHQQVDEPPFLQRQSCDFAPFQFSSPYSEQLSILEHSTPTVLTCLDDVLQQSHVPISAQGDTLCSNENTQFGHSYESGIHSWSPSQFATPSISNTGAHMSLLHQNIALGGVSANDFQVWPGLLECYNDTRVPWMESPVTDHAEYFQRRMSAPAHHCYTTTNANPKQVACRSHSLGRDNPSTTSFLPETYPRLGEHEGYLHLENFESGPSSQIARFHNDECNAFPKDPKISGDDTFDEMALTETFAKDGPESTIEAEDIRRRLMVLDNDYV